LSAGAAAVRIGTAFIATHESRGHPRISRRCWPPNPVTTPC
jgi:NAD(P)H-dependent flavin oxidoreductase YrpB (nitropropane dioxygenase family)